VLQAVQLPAARADLNPCLANMDGDDLANHQSRSIGA
jgi:hypothetical protein